VEFPVLTKQETEINMAVEVLVPTEPQTLALASVRKRVLSWMKGPMFVGCAGIDAFCCGPAIYLVCSNFASAAIAWQEIGGI
jgi:hypothetical protein